MGITISSMAVSSFPPVTVIIPNFNGAHLLRKNLPFVIEAAAMYPGESSVIVVDDGSSDNSQQVVSAEFPAIQLVRHETNRGFSEAIRTGVKTAFTELLVFLNSDVRPDPRFIAPLLRHFDRPDIFSVAPLVMDENLRTSEVSWRCYRILRGRLRGSPWRYDETVRRAHGSLFASGGSMAVRKSMFLCLGGFLPIFKPFYSEDADLGIRAWRRGWWTLFEPESLVVHGRTGSIKENIRPWKIRLARERNRYLLEWIHVPLKDLILFLLPRCVLRLFGRLLRLDFVSLGAWFAALLRLPEVLRARREIRQSAVLGFWEVMDIIERDAKMAKEEKLRSSG